METSLRDARAFVATHVDVEAGYETLIDLLNKHSRREYRRSAMKRAISAARETIEIATARRKKFPSDTADLALAAGYTLLANPLSFTGQLEEARDILTRSIELREILLAKSPTNATWKRALINEHVSLARIFWAFGAFHLERPAECRDHLLRALAIADELFARDPKNVLAEGDVYAVSSALTDVLAESDPAAAQRHAARAFNAAAAALARSPNTSNEKSNFADALTLGVITKYRNNPSEAIAVLERVLAIRWENANKRPEQPGLKYGNLHYYRLYASFLIKAARRADAARAFAEGEKIARLIDPDKTSLVYVAIAAMFYNDLAAFSGSCDARAKEAAIWRSLAERKVALGFVTPRLAAAEKRAAACKQ